MKIIIGGDVSPQKLLNDIIDNECYEEALGELRTLFKTYDFAIVNYETTLQNDHAKPIYKNGPNLCASGKLIDALDWAGVNVVTLANNHVGDYGEEPLIQLFGRLNDSGIHHVGAGANLKEAENILYLRNNDETLAIINCCENEYGVATADSAGSNPLNPIRQYYAITEARKNADYVLVIVHGGHEMFSLPSPRMQETYRFFIDAGADAVVNGHQHCYSGCETYNGKPIYYGIGNLMFDPLNNSKTQQEWLEGIMLHLEFHKDSTLHAPIPFRQNIENEKYTITLLKDKSLFEAHFHNLSKIISDPLKLKSEVDAYYSACSKQLDTMIQPWPGKYLRAAYYKGLLPSILTSDCLLRLQNMVNCESHRDKLKYFFNKKSKR